MRTRGFWSGLFEDRGGAIVLLGLMLFGKLVDAQTAAPDSIAVTISQQPSPYKLDKGTYLYSAITCSQSSRVRTISAGQIRQVAEDNHIAFVDPALMPTLITKYVGKSVKGRLLTVVSDVAPPAAGASAAVAAAKIQLPNIGSAKGWALGAVGAASAATLVPMWQKQLQGDVNALQTSITNGVAAAMIKMDGIYTVPISGCSQATMFLGVGDVKTVGPVVLQ